MKPGSVQSVHLKFQISDLTLASVNLPLYTQQWGLPDLETPVADPSPPQPSTYAGTQGYMMRALPVAGTLPEIQSVGAFVRYVVAQYRRFYIDMSGDFSAYRQKFSPKTRSTISRKLKKFAEYSGGEIDWRVYKTVDELAAFLPLARTVSQQSYQERLLDCGLPADAGFRDSLLALAAKDEVRAFLLLHEGRPVSYLLCPVRENVLIYDYLGYDQSYREWSVGTVLQWLALEHLFAERRFRYFDFTEGESDHKRLFATHDVQCANLMFLRDSLSNRLTIRAHRNLNRFSAAMGRLLDRWNVRPRVRRLIRFGF